MKEKLKKGFLILIIGFILLFLLRLIYGYIKSPESQSNRAGNYMNVLSSNESYFLNQRKNVASFKRKMAVKQEISGTTFSVDQKYEKIANMGVQSENFDSDEKKIRESIKKFAALIQLENRSGLKGKRKLRLGIGVPPQQFDSMITDLKDIGKLLYLQIDKVDKTNEYKDLNAKRKSLMKTKESLITLRKKAGKIEELIQLENRILEFEQQLQNLGVKLGEFDSENEFVTIKLYLEEGKAKLNTIPFSQRLFIAFTWTVKYYAAIIITLFFGILGIFILLKIIEALHWFPDYIDSLDKKS